jgi:predicted nucleic acid-binding protein
MKVLDTSIAIDHLRGLDAAVDLLTASLDAGEALVASEVVRFELLAGARDGEMEGIEDLSSAFSWVPVSEEVTRTAAALARRHRKSHSGIDDADYLIAATALLLDAELLTTNVRHFPMIPELKAPY